MRGGTGSTDLHEFVPKAKKSRIDDHGRASWCDAINRSGEKHALGEIPRRRLPPKSAPDNASETLKVINHPLTLV